MENIRTVRVNYRQCCNFTDFINVVNNGEKTYNEKTKIVSWKLINKTSEIRRAGMLAEIYIINENEDPSITLTLTPIDNAPISRSYRTLYVIDNNEEVINFIYTVLKDYYADDIIKKGVNNLKNTKFEIC